MFSVFSSLGGCRTSPAPRICLTHNSSPADVVFRDVNARFVDLKHKHAAFARR